MNAKFFIFVVLAGVLVGGGLYIFKNLAPASPVVSTQPPVETPAAFITITPAQVNKEGVPTDLGDLKLQKVTTGKEALAEFSRLHGKDFEVTGGYMAEYAGGGNQATLWVAFAKDTSAATELTEAMARRIGPKNAMFEDLLAMDIGGRALFTAVSKDQQHFFYAVNDKVVWLAADFPYAPQALHSLWGAVK